MRLREGEAFVCMHLIWRSVNIWARARMPKWCRRWVSQACRQSAERSVASNTEIVSQIGLIFCPTPLSAIPALSSYRMMMQVRDMGVVAVALNCRGLLALGLHCCRRLTDASMAACALRLRHLSSLNVSGCLSMSAAAVQVRICDISRRIGSAVERAVVRVLS